MTGMTPQERRRLYLVGLFIVVVGIVLASIPAINRPAGRVFEFVLGLLLASFSLLMAVNPRDIRGRWQRSGAALSARIFPEAWVRAQTRSYPNKRWYWVLLFALGCFMMSAGI